jgi:hypothetical protein
MNTSNSDNHPSSREPSPNVTSIPQKKNKVMTFFNDSSKNDHTGPVDSKEPRESISKDYLEEVGCPRCSQKPQYISRTSKETKMNILGNSVRLDSVLLEKVGALLSNYALKKDNEAEYFGEMNIFDQEWEFPFNKRHYEYNSLLEDIEANPLEIRVNLYKKSLIEMQMQLRNLSDYFIRVDRERIFFRQKLISVLQAKINKLVDNSSEVKEFVETFAKPNTSQDNDQISRLKKENKESQSLFVNMKRRNVKLEEEVKQLKKKLKEKRTQLKKYMFRKDGPGEDHNNTRTTTNSNNPGLSMETSNISRDANRNYPPKNKTLVASNQRPTLKFSSTILPNNPNTPTRANKNFDNANQLPQFLKDSASNFQSTFANAERGKRRSDRASIQTDSGTVEIPQMLMNLHSQRKSRLSGLKVNDEERRDSRFQLMQKINRPKVQGNLSSKLLNIKKRNSKMGHDQMSKNPFTFKKGADTSQKRNTSKNSTGSQPSGDSK